MQIQTELENIREIVIKIVSQRQTEVQKDNAERWRMMRGEALDLKRAERAVGDSASFALLHPEVTMDMGDAILEKGKDHPSDRSRPPRRPSPIWPSFLQILPVPTSEDPLPSSSTQPDLSDSGTNEPAEGPASGPSCEDAEGLAGQVCKGWKEEGSHGEARNGGTG
jgi:hypothetical protein